MIRLPAGLMLMLPAVASLAACLDFRSTTPSEVDAARSLLEPTEACVVRGGELQLTNVRATYGVLGPTRSGSDILPGDIFSIAFDIENLTADKEGKVMYNMGMELINPQGQSEYKRDPEDRPLTIFNVLGGNRIPAFAQVLRPRLGVNCGACARVG